MPAWKEPSPRNPSLDRQDFTAKQALSLTSSTILGGIASARDDWVSNASVIAVLRARRMVCTARSAASRPWSGSPNSSWHSENSADQRPQIRVLLGQLSGDLLRAQIGQPGLAPTDLVVQRAQRVQRGGHDRSSTPRW